MTAVRIAVATVVGSRKAFEKYHNNSLSSQRLLCLCAFADCDRLSSY